MEKLTDKEVAEQIRLQNFAQLIAFAGGKQEERWVTATQLEEGDKEVCPICIELADLGYVDFGLLPPFRQAHSIIGEGRWLAPDSSCQCRKTYRRVKGAKAKGVIPISGYNGDNSIADPKLKFSEEKKYTTEEVKEKLKQLKIKFSSHNGCSHK